MGAIVESWDDFKKRMKERDEYLAQKEKPDHWKELREKINSLPPNEEEKPTDPLHDALELISQHNEEKAKQRLEESALTSAPGRDPLRTTDIGNAERFAYEYRHQARFCSGAWYIWDSKCWKRDDNDTSRRLGHNIIKGIYHEAISLEDQKEQFRLSMWAKKSETTQRITAMLREAQANIRLAISSDRLDSPRTKYLFNCENGTIDVRTGTIRSHDPNDLITRISPIHYNPLSTCGPFQQFLEQILPDASVRDFLQRWIGSSLTGDTSDQKFVIFHGNGANGKSTLISILLQLFGDYGKQANFDTFLLNQNKRQSGSARPDLMAFKNARFVAAVEAGAGRQLDETVVKALTGGDALSARELYSKEITFIPECKITLVANNRPEIKGNNNAIWRRVLEVPFEVTIPPEEQDGELTQKLTTPEALTGILTWAVHGAMEWWNNKNQRLQAPEAIILATEDYKDEEDHIGPFIEDCLIVETGAYINNSDLWGIYLDWAEKQRIHPYGRKTFALLLQGAGFKRAKSNNERRYKGLRAKQSPTGRRPDPLWDQ